MSGNPVGDGSESEAQWLAEPAADPASSASDAPHALLSPPQSEERPGSARRSLERKFRIPVILAILGLALLGVGFAFFPTRSQYPAPDYDQILVSSTVPLSLVKYRAVQISPTTDKLNVTVIDEFTGSALRTSGGGFIVLRLPAGVHFRTCPPRLCHYDSADRVSIWSQAFRLKVVRIPVGGAGAATVTGGGDFYVKAQNLGVTYNGVNAAAALPQLNYEGRGSPTLVTTYNIPSANSYVWNAPTTYANTTEVTFGEATSNGTAAPSLQVGVNQIAQQHDTFYAFVVGIIVGLAGGALVAAVQEALHVTDDKHTKTASYSNP